MSWLVVPVTVSALIALQALYVAAEFATVSARRTRLAQLAHEGDRLASLLHAVVEDPRRLDAYIAACQVGITASNLILGFYGQARVAEAEQALQRWQAEWDGFQAQAVEPTQTAQVERTRINHLMVAARLAGTDGLSETPLFDMATLQDLMYSNRVYGAEIALDDTLQICAQYLADPPGDAAEPTIQALTRTCDVLRQWDRKVDLDSRGAQVFTEYWGGIRDELGNDFQNVVDSARFWRVDFDPADPLNTPAGIDLAQAENRATVIAALLRAHERLTAAGVALDAPWGEVQFLERNNERVPIHGGDGNMGVFGAISAGLQEGGYRNPGSGNSYIQTVTWDESDCPIADTILTHSQSVQPSSVHYSDQTKLYADKRWVRFPFCEGDIAAQQIGETLLLEE